MIIIYYYCKKENPTAHQGVEHAVPPDFAPRRTLESYNGATVADYLDFAHTA